MSNSFRKLVDDALDIGYDENAERFGVIEVNCFNSSGWYDCNFKKVASAVEAFKESE